MIEEPPDEAPELLDPVDPDDEDDDGSVPGDLPEPVSRPGSKRPNPRDPVPSAQGDIPRRTTRSTSGVNHVITQAHPDELTLSYDKAEAFALAQVIVSLVQTYSLKAGLKKFGDEGRKATYEEMKQLHDRNCFEPVDINGFTPEERRAVMATIFFLTQKRDGRIKGRACADGSKQRTFMTKEEAASPTVSMETISLTSVIDAEEGREVAVIDIPNAFIQTDNEKLSEDHPTDLMKVSGELAKILVEVDPTTYGPYLTEEKGVPVIYLKVIKAIYGQIKSVLLFYRRLRRDLEAEGFVINPCDICCAIKMVNGKQLTLLWHVDDIKASHVDPKVIDDFVEWCRKTYAADGITELKPSRGKVHDYLGMILDFSVKGKVVIQMKDYIKKMLREFPFPEQVNGLKKPSTPAAEFLFTVNDKAEKLSPKLAEIFHTTVAQALFLTKRARPDLQPSVPFLCTRVAQPDVDDWKKMIRMLAWLKATVDMPLTLEADGKGDVVICKWFPDVAFAVHSDFKSHTGSVMTLGKGSVNTYSAKQKLNTRSSTEAEVVGVDDIATSAVWTHNFLDAQGYDCRTTIYQDNTSAILLEKNGKESSSKRTRHMNIRFFFIKDCVDKRLFDLEYCPTDDMVGDFPSKPLQGRKFKKHLKSIMNLPEDYNHNPASIGQQE